MSCDCRNKRQVVEDWRVNSNSEKIGLVLNQINACPEILEFVFKNLDIERLKVARRVCKAWNEEICRLLRQLTLPRFKTAEEYGTFQTLVTERESPMSLPTPFSQVMLLNFSPVDLLRLEAGPFISSPFPLTKVIIQGGKAKNMDEFSAPRLLQYCSRTLTHFKVSGIWRSEDGNSSESTLGSLEFPELKSLSVNFRNSNYRIEHLRDPETMLDERQEEIIQDFISIIGSAPNLNHLELTGEQVIPQILRGSDLNKIEKLYLDKFLYSQVLRILLEKPLDALKYFSLRSGIISDENTKGLLKAVIEKLGPSLVELELSRKICVRFNFPPVLPCLEILGVHNPKFGETVGLLPGSLPALKHTTVTGPVVPSPDAGSFNTVESVTAFHFEDTYPPVSMGRQAPFRKLLQAFPHARSWQITYKYLALFCKVASRMEIPVEKMSLRFVFTKCLDEFDIENIAGAFSNLHLLKYLKRLDLSCWYEHGNHCDIDMVGQLPLYAIPTISILGFFLNNSCNFSSLMKLSKELQRFEKVIIRNNAGWSKRGLDMETFLQEVPQAYFIAKVHDFA